MQRRLVTNCLLCNKEIVHVTSKVSQPKKFCCHKHYKKYNSFKCSIRKGANLETFRLTEIELICYERLRLQMSDTK